MKMIKKNRKGFTLVELMLSIAIICLLGGVIVSVVMAISNSFTTTYNIDDSADYAMLFAKGFENSFLANTQKTGHKDDVWEWYVANPQSDGDVSVPTLMVKTPDKTTATAVFDPMYLGGNTSPYKWEILMFYKWDPATENVLYRVYLQDNFNDSNFVYSYDGSFWVPRYGDRKANNKANGRSIDVDEDSLPMTRATLELYGFDTSKIQDEQFDSDYKTKIVYTYDADTPI